MDFKKRFQWIGLYEGIFVLLLLFLLIAGTFYERSEKIRLLRSEAYHFSDLFIRNLKLRLNRDKILFLSLREKDLYHQKFFKSLYDIDSGGFYRRLYQVPLSFSGYRGAKAKKILLEEIFKHSFREEKLLVVGPRKSSEGVFFALVTQFGHVYRVAELDWESYLESFDRIPEGFYLFPIDLSDQVLSEYPFLTLPSLQWDKKQVRINRQLFDVFRFWDSDMNLKFNLLVKIPSLFESAGFFLILFLMIFVLVLSFLFFFRRSFLKEVAYPLFLVEEGVKDFDGESIPDLSSVRSVVFQGLKEKLNRCFLEWQRKKRSFESDRSLFSTLFNEVDYPFIVTDFSFRVLRSNAKADEFFFREEKRKSLDVFLNFEQIARLKNLLEDNIENFFDFRLKFGRYYRDFRLFFYPVGQQEKILFVFEDRSDLNRLRHRVFQLQRLQLMSSAIRGVVHDLNNELTGALGILELQSSEEICRNQAGFEDLKRSLFRSADLVKELSVSEEKREAVIKKENLKELLSEVVEWVRQSLLSSFSVKLKFGPEDLFVRADRIFFRQAFYKILLGLGEALFRFQELKLVIEAKQKKLGKREKKKYELEETLYVRVLIRLESSNQKTNLNFAFLRLDLSEINEICEAFGAKVFLEVENNETNHLIVFIPKEEGPERKEEEREQTELVTKTAKILIVDDDALVRNVTRQFLIREGYEVLSADNAWTAKEKLKSFHPDLIISDLRMPEYDGFYLIKYLEDHGIEIPLLLMSAYFELVDIRDIRFKGFCGILDKPFTYDQLIEKVSEIIGR